QFAYLQDGKGATDCREIPFVSITEWCCLLLPCHPLSDHSGHIATCLHSYGSDPWQKFPILCDASCIANHKNVGMIRNAQITQHFDPPCTIHIGLQPLTSRRGFYTCAPNDCLRLDTFSCNQHTIVIYSLNSGTCSDLHTQVDQCPLRTLRQT